MLDLRIQQHFIDSADLHYQVAEGLAKPVDAAVQAVLACVTGGITAGHAGILTEQQAIARALARPAVQEAERQHLLAAESAVSEAGLRPNPVVSLDRDRTRAPAGDSTETTWKISQTLDLSGKRALTRQGAQKRLDAVVAEQAAARQSMTARVRQTFAEALAGEQTRQAMLAWQDRLARAGATVARLASAGEVSGYDRRRLERELQTARAKRQEADASLIRIRHQLASLVALTDSAALTAIMAGVYSASMGLTPRLFGSRAGGCPMPGSRAATIPENG